MPQSCQRCGIGDEVESSYSSCEFCHLIPSEINKLHCLFPYYSDIEQQIKEFKYHGKFSLAAYFVELILAFLESEDSAWDFDTLLPIPSSRKNLAQRGYGHMHLIASGLSERLGIPAPRFALSSKGKRSPQVSLHGKERERNMREAFASKSAMLQGKKVLLLDDVITSGATVFEAARELSRSGVERVEVLCVAQSPLFLQHLMESRSLQSSRNKSAYAS